MKEHERQELMALLLDCLHRAQQGARVVHSQPLESLLNSPLFWQALSEMLELAYE